MLFFITMNSIINQLQSQQISSIGNLIDPDTLLIKIQHESKFKCNNTFEFLKKYDFKYQYPYFQSNNEIYIDDELSIEFEIVPKSGFIYCYRLDGENNLEFIQTLVLNEEHHQMTLSMVVPMSNYGDENLVFLYSKHNIEEIESILNGIEMMLGKFIYRHNQLLKQSVIIPSRTWRFLDIGIGFEIEKKLDSENKWTLPLIVNYIIKN